MVASPITIDAVYLDGRVRSVLANSVSVIEDNTVASETDNGLTTTNPRWSRARHNWTLSWSSESDFIENLYLANRTAYGFLFISPIELERVAENQPIGTGNGSATAFQLKVTNATTARSSARNVLYPLAGSVIMYVDGVAKTPGVDFTFSTTTGIVTFAVAPASGKPITADFEYAWPVRFTSKTISRTWVGVDRVETRSAQIEEVF